MHQFKPFRGITVVLATAMLFGCSGGGRYSSVVPPAGGDAASPTGRADETKNINVSHGFDTFGQDYNGWSNSCFTCIMMRTVSIAQKGDNFNSGSLFGTVSWNYSVLEQGSNASIPWDATTNQECINYPGWYDYYNATQECSAGPPSGAVSNNIEVSWTDYANQDVTIRTY